MYAYVYYAMFVCVCMCGSGSCGRLRFSPAMQQMNLEGTSAPPLEVGLHVSGKLSASRVSGFRVSVWNAFTNLIGVWKYLGTRFAGT